MWIRSGLDLWRRLLCTRLGGWVVGIWSEMGAAADDGGVVARVCMSSAIWVGWCVQVRWCGGIVLGGGVGSRIRRLRCRSGDAF